jgi:hypothetical protein
MFLPKQALVVIPISDVLDHITSKLSELLGELTPEDLVPEIRRRGRALQDLMCQAGARYIKALKRTKASVAEETESPSLTGGYLKAPCSSRFQNV